MDIQQLKTFYVVARAGSFSKAVDELNLSQPAISRQVMLLEESLNARLFNRHARKGLVLTAEGETLLDRATDLLRTVENLKACLSETAEPQGRLRIATSHLHISTWLMPTLTSFMHAYPALDLEVVCQEERMDLTLRDADVYVGPFNPSLVGHEQDFLMNQHVRLFAAEDYLMRAGTPSTLADLKNHQLLSYGYMKEGSQSKHPQWLSYLYSPQGQIASTNRLVINSLEGLVEAVAGGLGIAPLIDTLPLIAQKGLVPVLPSERSAPLRLYCTYLTQAKPHANIKAFVTHLKADVAKTTPPASNGRTHRSPH